MKLFYAAIWLMISASVVSAEPCMRHAGRGGFLLPGGYLSTRGSQIVADDGITVRIASIGWSGTDSPAGSTLDGLWATSYRDILDSIKAAGFNTVRLPWSDVNLDAPPANTAARGNIDYKKNPDLKGLTTFLMFKKVVSYAGAIGLKVIFDHHTNQGCCGQQPNGLWYDKGPGSNGTDGRRHVGTVAQADFLKNWLRFARQYSGNSSVIGFDLANEPTSYGKINWGRSGPTDIKAMYERVGAAIQKLNPRVLIIAEGPQTYNPPSASSGMDPTIRAPEGNLTGVATAPVQLPIPNKVVYSVHEYPNEIAEFPGPDDGPAFVRRMNRAWGYLVTRNIAPVWIGEMGSSMRSPESHRWANTLLDYMNGKYHADGGPAFSGADQPIGGSWWHIGPASDEPDGLQSKWGAGNYRPAQIEVTDQLLFKPAGGSACRG